MKLAIVIRAAIIFTLISEFSPLCIPDSPKNLVDEFQNMPPIDVAAMNDYDQAVLFHLLNRSAAIAGVRFKSPPRVYNQSASILVEGPPYVANYRSVNADKLQDVKGRLIALLKPLANSTDRIAIAMGPSDRTLTISPATAGLGATDLKPEYLSGATIVFPKIWTASKNVIFLAVNNLEMDAKTEKNGPFPWEIKSKWKDSNYRVEGFVVREQITLRLDDQSIGGIRLSTDSEIQMRRPSSDKWINVTLPPSYLKYTAVKSPITIQDICIHAIWKILINSNPN